MFTTTASFDRTPDGIVFFPPKANHPRMCHLRVTWDVKGAFITSLKWRTWGTDPCVAEYAARSEWLTPHEHTRKAALAYLNANHSRVMCSAGRKRGANDWCTRVAA